MTPHSEHVATEVQHGYRQETERRTGESTSNWEKFNDRDIVYSSVRLTDDELPSDTCIGEWNETNICFGLARVASNRVRDANGREKRMAIKWPRS